MTLTTLSIVRVGKVVIYFPSCLLWIDRLQQAENGDANKTNKRENGGSVEENGSAKNSSETRIPVGDMPRMFKDFDSG